MAKICMSCNKRPQVANNVSHAKNRTKRWLYPNLHRIRFTMPNTGTKVYSGNVCSKCIKAKKVIKVL